MSSFYGNGSAKGGGGGTLDYNALDNKPIVNLTGITPIDFSALPEDVYNIKGNYKYSANGEIYTWLSANLVYVSKDTLTDNKIVRFDAYENDKRYSITIIYSDDDYKVEKFAYDVIDESSAGVFDGQDLTVKFADEIKGYSDEWAWAKARKNAGNYAGMHVGDYIPITCSNGYVLKAQIAGINTYTGYGDQEVGNHIDFICKEPWNDLHVMNKVNYNNGNANNPSPFLASDLNYWLNSMSGTVPNSTSDAAVTTEVDYTTDGVLYYLPDKLKNQIIPKRIMLPSRYKAGSVLTNDNSWAWQSTGKLWIPSEVEVYGVPCWGNSGYGAGGFVQYPLFACNMNRVKRQYSLNSRYNWWLLSAFVGNSTYFAAVTNNGNCNYGNATSTWIAAPVCFRI